MKNTATEAVRLVNYIISDMPDFEGKVDDWQGVLEALEDGQFLEAYFYGEDTEENRETVEVAYDMVQGQIDIIK